MATYHRQPRVRSRQARDLAREARQNPSLAERIAWRVLRDRCLGFKFRREHNLGSYRADFYCAEARLVVEFDGEQHDPVADALRDAEMQQMDLMVLRIPNRAFFMLDPVPPHEAFSKILRACEERTGRRGEPF